MADRWFNYLLFGIIATASHCNAKQEEQCFEPTAAINFHGDVYLIDGNKFVLIDSDFTEADAGTVADEFGHQGEVDAAFVDAEQDNTYFNSGTKYYQYSYESMSTEGPLDNSDRNPFLAEGIDAAARLGDHNYFFKGCKYFVGGKTEEGDLKSLGLPCDLDAAWHGEDGKLYATKGEEVWSMDVDGQVTGPEMLTKLVTLKSTEFCDHATDIQTFNVKDEKKYEEEHNCVIIDAAISWNGRIYLFNNDEYLAFNKHGRQYVKAPISSWGGLVPNIDAGVIWSGNRATYFFKGDQYYRYYKKRSQGPRYNKLWDSRFTQGIDAAGNFHGKTYFFQGCEIVRYSGPKPKVDGVYKSEDASLPCHVDAAFSKGRKLFVIKLNKVWLLSHHKKPASGPKDLTRVLHVKSWNLCSLQ